MYIYNEILNNDVVLLSSCKSPKQKFSLSPYLFSPFNSNRPKYQISHEGLLLLYFSGHYPRPLRRRCLSISFEASESGIPIIFRISFLLITVRTN